MKKETKFTALILTVAIVLCVAVSGWIILTAETEKPLVIPETPEVTPETDFDISNYEIKGNVPDVVKPLEENNSTSVTVTEDKDGNKTITNDWTKPEEPEKPVVDEDQLTDPDKKPEYKPPAEPDTPKPGDRNDKGQVYDRVFGWLTPSEGEGRIADFELSGEKVGNM